MNTFHEMGLPSSLKQSLDKFKFTVPTLIQAQAIPVALQDKDILGSAQTGTGKTLAFAVPLVAKLIEGSGSALVLVPTRELAQQVMETVKKLLAHNHGIKTALLIGGEPYIKQLKQLKAKPRIVVGTPGRIIDQLERRNLRCDDTHFLVLDEADRMFDMGFGIQLEQIIKCLPSERQTLMFSATLPKAIEKLANQHLINPERISIGSVTVPFAKIKQEMVKVSEADKFKTLLSQLEQREGSILVFVKTKFGADKLADKLIQEDHPAIAIHGDLRQTKRERVIKAFRQGRHRIMVATDIAARGLDIPHIQHVINYDLPQSPEDYIHRIGRTARAGAEGSALCMVTPQEGRKWIAIRNLIDPENAGKEKSRGHFSKEKPSRERAFQGKFSKEKNGKEKSFKERAFKKWFSKDEEGSKEKPAKKRFFKEEPTKEKSFRENTGQGKFPFEKPAKEQDGKRRPFQAKKPGKSRFKDSGPAKGPRARKPQSTKESQPLH